MSWQHFSENYHYFSSIQLSLDTSNIMLASGIEDAFEQAFSAMDALESGAIANPDEGRMVGHYWLRDSGLAPAQEIGDLIESNLAHIKEFTQSVHSHKIQGKEGPFKHLLVVGIGGSALGPQFVAQALGSPSTDKLEPHFFDNTDPDGMSLVLEQIGAELGQTLVIVISKSGSTPETYNGMIAAQNAYQDAGLNFSDHAIAITGEGSKLHRFAVENHWLDSFPLWDWVGGRTSELSAVGLLPAALQGIDIDGMLQGARETDALTRVHSIRDNPAALLASAWYQATSGKGEKDMVILPYKDRLSLFAKYLQQLVMESLGKEKDLSGRVVNQGIAVYGNKGSTDQHAYVQQLRDGLNNFFVTFVHVLKDSAGFDPKVSKDFTSGDYLHAFLLGTQQALAENNRESLTITIDSVTSFSVGSLIALYERATGLYASLIGINAYHQPGVEAGKKAAQRTLDLQLRITSYLKEHPDTSFSAKEVGEGLSAAPSDVFNILTYLAANPRHRVDMIEGVPYANSKFQFKS